MATAGGAAVPPFCARSLAEREAGASLPRPEEPRPEETEEAEEA